jgi:plastocyanin
MRSRAARLAALGALLLLIALASTASAATTAVNIQGFAFVPPSVTITVGDTVTWMNKDAAAHSVDVSGVGHTPVLTQNQSGGIAFNAAGTFSYVCGIHGAAMMGTVIVRAAATPPPTLPPTQAPTLAPTPVPTSVPTTAPTVPPTVAPTPSASLLPTASPAPSVAAPSGTALASVVVAVPTQQAPAPAASNDGGPSPLVIGGTAIVLIGLAAFALTRIRR